MGVLTFIETKLFTRLVQNYFTDDEYAELQNSIVANPRPVTSFADPVAFGNCGGAWPDAGNEVAFGSSTTCGCSRVKCGC